MSKYFKSIYIFVTLFSLFFTFSTKTMAWRFVAWGDTKTGTATLTSLSPQVVNLNPVFTIYAGDSVDSWGSSVVSNNFNNFTKAINGGPANNGLFNKTFAVRGNHEGSSSTEGWQTAWDFLGLVTKIGGSNYKELTKELTYSFDYQNAHFIGVDVLGDASNITSAQIAWIDSDLTSAEARGIKHSFIWFHGPIYCAAEHCSCSTTTGCVSTAAISLIKVLNKHSSISATFHGHEHVYVYTHLDDKRIPEVPGMKPIEQFITGDAGAGPATTKSNRYDYWLNKHGFVTVDINSDTAYTVSIYAQGSSTPDKVYNFNKTATTPVPTAAVTPTPVVTKTPTPIVTPTKVPTPTPIATKTPTPTPSTSKLPTPTPSSTVNLRYDLNNDGRVDLLDIMTLIKVLFI